MEHHKEGGTDVYIYGPGHMTKMATMAVNSMKHQTIELYKVYINHDPGMTLTYITARSTWVTNAFEWGKLVHFVP